MRLRSLGALGAFAVLAALMLVVSASGADTSTAKQTYIVQMLENPVVAYEGGTAGLAATKPAKDQKIDPSSAAVKKYAAYLASQHDAALQKVGGAAKLYDYVYTYNGFAAKLTAGQKTALEKQAGVLAVSTEETVTADTSSTPAFLGLTAPGGLWEQLGGPTAAKSGVGAGENVIIGVVDSGIWPENKSFSDRDAAGQLLYQQIPGWHGKCTPGEGFNSSMCNQKLIGGQHFNASWGGDAAIEAQRPWEFTSVRDYNGHGTHTAGTAGGNNGVAATGPAAVFGSVSGMAPRARVAAYKALWSTQDGSTASGLTGDLVAAIDQSVADGVDVINYSISGSQTNFADPVMISFLFAADAGVFVAASAGNSGPTTSTVAHPSPWMTTVAAGTHNRDGRGSVTLGNGATYNGASVATPIGPKPFIDSTAAALPGADATLVALCYGAGDNGGKPVLDPAKVAGKIVLCDRGVTGRVNKSLAVQQAGGVGMILVNTSANSLNADFHFVPTVHLSHLDRPALKAYAATAGATATINASTNVFDAPNTNPLVIFRQGAGHVRPNNAADPGLVYDSSWNDWLAFLCGTTTAVNPASCTALKAAGFSTDASDMNVASIAIGNLAGVQTVKRRVTNVGSAAATYTSSVTGMTGITTTVAPSTLALNAGETKSFTVTFRRTTAALNAYTGGQLTWSDGTHGVRSPIVIQPVALAAPAQVTGTGAPISYPVTFGYDGLFAAAARGLVPAVTTLGTVQDDPTDSTCSLTSPNAQKQDVVVPAGTTYARFSLFDAFTDGEDDLDLCVFRGTTLVGTSGSGTSAEEVNLVDPTAATYTVVVQGWGTDGPDAQYTLFHWLLGSTAAGNMAVTAPAAATTGGTGSVNLTFSGLAPTTKYLGSVAYSGVAGLPNPTIVRVDTP